MLTLWILILTIEYSPLEISEKFETEISCELAAEKWREESRIHRAVCLPLPTEQPE